MVDSLAQDLRHSVRSLSKQPGFVAVAVLSLAVGMAVNTAIFSTMDALLFRPPALRDLDRSVIIYHASPGIADRGTSFPAFDLYRTRTDAFADVMAWSAARPVVLIDGDRRDQAYAELVTSKFFSVASVTLQLGSAFTDRADRASDPEPVVVLSHRFWQRRFDSDAGVVGRTLTLNSRPFTVTGVAGEGFTGLDVEASADLWMPVAAWAHLVGEPARLTGEEHWLTTFARLQPGVSLEQARAVASVAGHALQPPAGQETKVRPASERVIDSMTDALAIGAGAFAVGLLVLVLACTNVANLLMARAAARQREMSVRMALGSSRGRLIRLWLAESLLLSLAAGVLGLVFASWLIDLVAAFKPPTLIGHAEAPALPVDFSLDVRVLTFALGLSLATTVLVGLVTGWQGSRPGALLATTSGRTSDRRFAPGVNVRSAVIALQMALSLTLLIPCGLFVRSWMNASAMAPGFSPEGVLLLPISADQGGVRVQKPEGFEQQLADRVAGIPGVEAVTVMDPVPLWFGGNFAYFSRESDEPGASQRIGHSAVTPGYFDTLRIPLMVGRDFTRTDNASSPAVAIVNEALARRFWPDGNAVGRRLRRGKQSIEVIGLARNAKYQNLAESPQPWVYLPFAQRPSTNPTLSLAVRASGDPMALRPGIEREVRSIVPAWPMFHFRTLDEGLKLQQLLPRLGATLLGVLGAFGLLLAAVGVYGVMAYVVRQRTHEIGIRLALGAPIRNVLALIVRQGMAVCLAGAVVGIGLALAAAQFLGSLLYGISAADPLTYVVVPTVLIVVALLACYLPARRITKVSALQALRHE